MTTGRECVFVVSDLIQRLQHNKAWFSKTVFDGIAKKATEGDVAAVNWLVEHGFMSVVNFDEITATREPQTGHNSSGQCEALACPRLPQCARQRVAVL